ncbi:protein phosphatase 2C domain-containing protein [Acinetobacter beijerinckii]|uniref:PP2C family serine/threonine-protein phosphatase n=1 Tax=Acinetobacter beijerinckii TaxID=262668 RepID=UPI0023DDF27D|nr:PP2C family serine/threonine-protein phosphatase [Acinetobacter beijerinckii]MDF2417226.1 protein phosphatase 2C domain-containing protein [Acinetobacter beijerinckii]
MSQVLHPEIQSAFTDLLTQLLQDKTQSPDLSENAEWISQLLKNKRIYNAYYDLAEQIYDTSAFQCEQLPYFHQTQLYHILQQGRQAIYLPCPNSLSEFEQPVDSEIEIEKNTVHTDVETRQSDFNQKTELLSLVLDCQLESAVSHEQSLDPQMLATNLQVVLNSAPNKDAPNVSTDIIETVKKMPYFQIPNARVGQIYQAKIQMQHPIQQPVYICADRIEISDDLGLCFNQDMQQLQGTPLQAGEFKLNFQYKINQEQVDWQQGEVTFIVTPDPRSLWQINEPDANEPYQKSHSDSDYIQAENFKIAASSQRGRSHEHAGSFRDDDFLIRQIDNSDWAILIVADGAGSADFSRRGSQLVVQSMGQILLDDLKQRREQLDQLIAGWQVAEVDQQLQALGQQLQDLFYQAALSAVEAIEHEAHEQQVDVKKFSTTLLAAIVKQQSERTLISSFWIGDGAIAVYSPDKIRLMGKPDGGEFAGQTRFLSRQVVNQFSAQVNIGYFQDCQAVLLMTDGISDPRFETDAGLNNLQKWQQLWQEIQPKLQHEKPDQALLEWSKFFSAGHHDDRTLAVLWRDSLQKRVDKNDNPKNSELDAYDNPLRG